MSLPITYLESVLKNKPTEQIKIKDEYVSLEELINFWIEQHQMLDKAKKILKEQPSEDKQASKVRGKTTTGSNISGKKTNKTKLSTK